MKAEIQSSLLRPWSLLAIVSMTRYALLICLALVLFATADVASAKKHPAARRHETLISNVSPTSLTIQEDGGPKTFVITAFTEVIVNDQRGSVAQLRKGMRVSVMLDAPTRVRQIKAWNTQ